MFRFSLRREDVLLLRSLFWPFRTEVIFQVSRIHKKIVHFFLWVGFHRFVNILVKRVLLLVEEHILLFSQALLIGWGRRRRAQWNLVDPDLLLSAHVPLVLALKRVRTLPIFKESNVRVLFEYIVLNYSPFRVVVVSV